MVGVPGYEPPDAIWIAAPTGSARIGFDSIPDAVWSDAQRVHQYTGRHDETWGGTTLNIDTNFVHGPVYPTDAIPAQSHPPSATTPTPATASALVAWPRPLLGFDTCALPSVAAMHSW